MRNYARFIPGEEIDAVAQWRFGDMDPESSRSPERVLEETQKDESLRQQGYAEGFVQGRAQAMLEAQRQINEFTQQQGEQAARQLAELLRNTQSRLDAAEQIAAQAVLELVCDLARQVLRQEITTNPNVLLPVIREALGMLFADSRSVQLRLNPQDLEVLQPVLQEEFATANLVLSADAAITRGGCQIESAGTVVDGRLEKRWARAIRQLGQNEPWEPADVNR